MTFDFATMAVVTVASLVGWIYVRRGRAEADVTFLLGGLALMGYGWVVDSLAWAIVIGVALVVAPLAWARYSD